MENKKNAATKVHSQKVSQIVDKFESLNQSSPGLNFIKKTNSAGSIPQVAIEIPYETKKENEEEKKSSIIIKILSEEEVIEVDEENKDDKRTRFLQAVKKSSTLSSFVCLDSSAFLDQMKYEENLLNETEKEDAPKMSTPKKRSELGSTQERKKLARENFARKYTIKSVAELSSGKLILPKDQGDKTNGNQVSFELEKEEKYSKLRKEVVEELVQTERDFVRDLEITITVFLTPIRRQKLLSSYEIVSLFSNLESLLPLNKALLDDLEHTLKITNLHEDTAPLYSQWVGEIFSAHTPKMNSLYSTYCSNQPNIHSRLTSYQNTNNEFKKFLDTCFRREECRKLEIDSFLILPLQRICKYPLFFKQLVNYTPEILNDGQFPALISGQKCVEEMVAQVNSKVKEVENLAKLVEVLFKIENGSDFFNFIVDETHEFLQEGTFNINGLRSYLFLFSNLLVFCNIRSLNTDNANDFCIQELNLPYQPFVKEEEKLRAYLCLYLRDCNINTSNTSKTDFIIEHKEKTYVINCHNKSAKTSWSSKIKKLITDCKNDTNISSKRKNSKIISLGNNTVLPTGTPAPSSSTSLPSSGSSTPSSGRRNQTTSSGNYPLLVTSNSSPAVSLTSSLPNTLITPPSPKGTSKGFLKRKKSSAKKKLTPEEELKVEVEELKKQLQQANQQIAQLKSDNEKLKAKLKAQS